MREPLNIIGVDTANVGAPRNDGTPGSALYSVPIRLSRTPTHMEAQLLVARWDRPSSYTMMHRPGIARVIGDRLWLNGTTVEEVRDRHATTLRLVVDATKNDAARYEEERQRERDAAAVAAQEHADHVCSVADDIKF